MRCEAGQTWEICGSWGNPTHIVTLCPQRCAKGYFYVLVLWDCGTVSLEAGQYAHMDAKFIERYGSLLS